MTLGCFGCRKLLKCFVPVVAGQKKFPSHCCTWNSKAWDVIPEQPDLPDNSHQSFPGMLYQFLPHYTKSYLTNHTNSVLVKYTNFLPDRSQRFDTVAAQRPPGNAAVEQLQLLLQVAEVQLRLCVDGRAGDRPTLHPMLPQLQKRDGPKYNKQMNVGPMNG